MKTQRRQVSRFDWCCGMIIRRLHETISFNSEGSGKPEFSIANFGGWPAMTFLADDADLQEQLRQRIIRSFQNRPLTVNFRAGLTKTGVIVTVTFA